MHCTWYTSWCMLLKIPIKGRKSSKNANKFRFFVKVIKCKKNPAKNICDVTVIFNCAKSLWNSLLWKLSIGSFFYIIINNFSVIYFLKNFRPFSAKFCIKAKIFAFSWTKEVQRNAKFLAKFFTFFYLFRWKP